MSTPISALVIAPHGLGATGVRRISPSLANLQKIVGGFIEPMYGYRDPSGLLLTWPTTVIYVNEEAKIHGGAALNLPATALWWHLDPQAAGRSILAGPAVVLGLGAGNDDTEHPVPEHVRAAFTAITNGCDPRYTGDPARSHYVHTAAAGR
jgi:hypothetical protein